MNHRIDYKVEHHVGTYYLTMYTIECTIASLHSGSSRQQHTESSQRIYSVSPRNLNSGSSCSLHIETSRRLHSESSRGLRKNHHVDYILKVCCRVPLLSWLPSHEKFILTFRERKQTYTTPIFFQ